MRLGIVASGMIAGLLAGVSPVFGQSSTAALDVSVGPLVTYSRSLSSDLLPNRLLGGVIISAK